MYLTSQQDPGHGTIHSEPGFFPTPAHTLLCGGFFPGQFPLLLYGVLPSQSPFQDVTLTGQQPHQKGCTCQAPSTFQQWTSWNPRPIPQPVMGTKTVGDANWPGRSPLTTFGALGLRGQSPKDMGWELEGWLSKGVSWCCEQKGKNDRHLLL